MIPRIVWFDGRAWLYREEGKQRGYIANLGSHRNPRPRSLTRHVYEKAHGPLGPGWKVIAVDGDYTNWSIDNLRAELGDPEYVEWHTKLREKMAQRDRFIAVAVSVGWDPDDAWDFWRGSTSNDPREYLDELV